jgi:outer membrane immunogenic protein
VTEKVLPTKEGRGIRLKIAGLVLVASASGAIAADMPSRAPYQKAAYATPAYNWTGFYVGAMGGYGWSDRVAVAGLVVTNADLGRLRLGRQQN